MTDDSPDPTPDPAVSSWRIDDLAQRADLTVDTVRFYQREGLLPAGVRVGLGSDVAAGPDAPIFSVMRAGAYTQNALRASPGTSAPAAWAAFVLVGEPSTRVTLRRAGSSRTLPGAAAAPRPASR